MCKHMEVVLTINSITETVIVKAVIQSTSTRVPCLSKEEGSQESVHESLTQLCQCLLPLPAAYLTIVLVKTLWSLVIVTNSRVITEH